MRPEKRDNVSEMVSSIGFLCLFQECLVSYHVNHRFLSSSSAHGRVSVQKRTQRSKLILNLLV